MVFFDSNAFVSTLIPWYTMLVSGFLVGLGMRLGRGCTSGHGINGIPSLSLGSLISIVLFMVLGFATASLCFYTDFMRGGEAFSSSYSDVREIVALVLLGATVIVEIIVVLKAEN